MAAHRFASYSCALMSALVSTLFLSGCGSSSSSKNNGGGTGGPNAGSPPPGGGSMTGGSGTTGSTTGSGTQPAVEPQERAVAPAARLEEPLVVQQEEAQVAVPQAAVRAAGS